MEFIIERRFPMRLQPFFLVRSSTSSGMMFNAFSVQWKPCARDAATESRYGGVVVFPEETRGSSRDWNAGIAGYRQSSALYRARRPRTIIFSPVWDIGFSPVSVFPGPSINVSITYVVRTCSSNRFWTAQQFFLPFQALVCTYIKPLSESLFISSLFFSPPFLFVSPAPFPSLLSLCHRRAVFPPVIRIKGIGYK